MAGDSEITDELTLNKIMLAAQFEHFLSKYCMKIMLMAD